MSQSKKIASKTPWLVRPSVDLIVGCGGWTLPLFAVVFLLTKGHGMALSIGFYALSLVINYPHYMATVYRAYHRQADFAQYRRYTLHLSLVLLFVLLLGHRFYQILPWVFTVYIIWSPWHYSGQNYGLASMFIQRAGVKLSSAQRRGWQVVFVSSYLMLAVAFLSQASLDPAIISFGLRPSIARLAQWFFLLSFGISALYASLSLRLKTDKRGMLAPAILISSQFLWFVLPVLLSLTTNFELPQVQYSSGILAILHSTQYLWITMYYARRESNATQTSAWKSWKYALVLVAGGIALFLPGPWIISYIGHYDFTSSTLFFVALVNIHHFMLDGVIWKLRDPKIASLLLDRKTRKEETSGNATDGFVVRPAYPQLRKFAMPLAATLLIGLGVVDLCRYFLGADYGKSSRLALSAKLNPNDAPLQLRWALADLNEAHFDGAVAKMKQAVALNPRNPVIQRSFVQLLVESQRYDEALVQYKEMKRLGLMDVDSLVNYGILAAENHQYDEAIASWTQALKIDPNQLNARLYLAETLNNQGQTKASIPHYEKYLTQAALQGGNVGLTPAQVAHVATKLADAYSKENCPDCEERASEYRKKASEFTTIADKFSGK
ncbi:MAG TPA: tetratricopeptide repeat protein [Blastocatellia bacterium]|nr:tetratricopeptide repeat protein [Blastocatellia bacterium]